MLAKVYIETDRDKIKSAICPGKYSIFLCDICQLSHCFQILLRFRILAQCEKYAEQAAIGPDVEMPQQIVEDMVKFSRFHVTYARTMKTTVHNADSPASLASLDICEGLLDGILNAISVKRSLHKASYPANSLKSKFFRTLSLNSLKSGGWRIGPSSLIMQEFHEGRHLLSLRLTYRAPAPYVFCTRSCTYLGVWRWRMWPKSSLQGL